ncbi:MAG: prenyltransferase/squalene oxidase repeat-containing protein [Kiritimatiellia bacterium]
MRSSLLDKMQRAAFKGAQTLRPEATAALTAAILSCEQSSGGFCGLDGKADLYYTFFAKMALNALGTQHDPSKLISWIKSVRKVSRGVDRVGAELMLLREGARSRVAATLFLLRSLLRVGPADSYKLFLTAFLMEELLPQKLTRALIQRAAVATLDGRARLDFNALSTPRAAVCVLLAQRTGDQPLRQRMSELLRQRHQASGGYTAVAGGKADLLSTAVVLFTELCLYNPLVVTKENNRDSTGGCLCAPPDRAFVEMCWQEDGLFSSAPDQRTGDLEHTFYALLALGCTKES